MNTKLITVCLVGAFVGAASFLAQAQDTNVPRECVGDGITPPSWDNANHHPELKWCCTAFMSGSLILGEAVRYWPNGVVRTYYDGTPDMGCAVLP